MFRKIVKLGWSEQTSSLGSVAFLLASFVPDTLEREQHQTASGLLKSSIELGKSTAALKALGESPETRGQSAQCGKCEQNLQAALARCNKFHNKATESQDDLCYEFLKESGRLIDEGNMILKLQAEHFIGQAEQEVKNAVSQVSPLAGGLPDGKSWKEGIKDCCVSCICHL